MQTVGIVLIIVFLILVIVGIILTIYFVEKEKKDPKKPGPSGAPGTNNPPGVSGASGTNNPPGVSGASGTNNPPGSSGASGTNNPPFPPGVPNDPRGFAITQPINPSVASSYWFIGTSKDPYYLATQIPENEIAQFFPCSQYLFKVNPSGNGYTLTSQYNSLLVSVRSDLSDGYVYLNPIGNPDYNYLWNYDNTRQRWCLASDPTKCIGLSVGAEQYLYIREGSEIFNWVNVSLPANTPCS